MGGALGKKRAQGSAGKSGEGSGILPLPGTSNSGLGFSKGRKNPLRHRNSLSEFSLTDLASNITHRFSVLSGLSFISFVSVPATEVNKRPWTRISRKRWHPSTLQNEYAQCKTVWPVAQTEALFLPEFPVGTEEKLKLILLGEIGRGAFGQVFHVKCSFSYREYAMKVLSKSQVCSLDAVRQVKQEVMIQHVCSHHPFIAPLTHFWQTRKLLIVRKCKATRVYRSFLKKSSGYALDGCCPQFQNPNQGKDVTEYIGYGELQQLWRSLGRLPESLLSLYVAEIALALDFLHNAGIIYRDLKMENILLDVDGHIKLIDFGLARWLTYGGNTKTICGTLQFMAPEILKGEPYGHSADWWSLGIIAYSLFVGHYPVSGCDDHITMGSAVEKFTYSPPEEASKAMKSLLTGLLQRSPSTRIHTLHQLQKEEMYMYVDFDDVRDKKMSPRMALEKFIEGKSRHNFEQFAGLTSTPKRDLSSCERHPLDCSSPFSSKSSRSPLMGNRALLWDRAKRSRSSPLLSSPLTHPGRLGHHDALVKSVSSTGYNGAAVPLLQSPLLRLARGQGAPPSSRRRYQRAVSASALPTAVSPLLVNVRGSRKGRWGMVERGRERQRRVPTPRDRDTDSSSSPGHSPIREREAPNGVYSKCMSVECVTEAQEGAGPLSAISQFRTGFDGSTFAPPWPPKAIPQKLNGYADSPVISLPKKEGSLQGSASILSARQFLPQKSSPKAVNFGPMSKCLMNGALLRSNFEPLGEKDFDDALEHFPWVSESLDA